MLISASDKHSDLKDEAELESCLSRSNSSSTLSASSEWVSDGDCSDISFAGKQLSC